MTFLLGLRCPTEDDTPAALDVGQARGERLEHLDLERRHPAQKASEVPGRDDEHSRGRGGDDRGRSRHAGDECDLAEEVARAERVDLAALPAHVRRPLDQYEELVPGRPLSSQLLARLEVDLVGDTGDLFELAL